MTGAGFLDEVRLHTAHNGQQLGDVSFIEKCDCPEQYVGDHCESCAAGFRREIPFGGRSSECVPCQCNGHSDSCDAETGTLSSTSDTSSQCDTSSNMSPVINVTPLAI